MIEDSAREAKTVGPLSPYLCIIYYRLLHSEIHIYVLYKIHFPRSLTSGTNLTFTGPAFYVHSYFRILILSHQPNLLCFFNLLQHSQRSSILQRDRTHYTRHINGRHCSGDAAEMQREQRREKQVLSQNHLPLQPTRSQIYGSSSTDFFCGNTFTGTQGLMQL